MLSVAGMSAESCDQPEVGRKDAVVREDGDQEEPRQEEGKGNDSRAVPSVAHPESDQLPSPRPDYTTSLSSAEVFAMLGLGTVTLGKPVSGKTPHYTKQTVPMLFHPPTYPEVKPW